MDAEINSTMSEVDKILETETLGGILVWHALFIICSAILTILILLCCCISFRIPRTKQEIEADYIRKQIARKFRKQLDLIQDSEMDEMDLAKAVEKVRFELMSDEEKAAVLFKLNNEPVSQVKEQIMEVKSDTPEKISISSNTALRTGNSAEKLMERSGTTGTFSNKLVTIVNAFSILRAKNKPSVPVNSKQMTV